MGLRGLLAIGLAVLATGCVGKPKAYLGQPRGLSQIGVVVPATQRGFTSHIVIIAKIDGQEEIGDWRAGGTNAELLPAEHVFDVECIQNTPPMGFFIIDLFTMIGDLTADKHKATLRFPIAAGMTHEVHLNEQAGTWAVLQRFSMEAAPTPPALEAPLDAIVCGDHPDRSAAFWCEVLPVGASGSP